MKKKNIKYHNNIPGKYFNKQKQKKNNLIVSKILQDIFENISKKKNTYHLLSKNLKLNFEQKDLIRYKNYKQIIVVGMGGSILGIKAIYSFLEKKINKKFIFIDNLNENQIANYLKFQVSKKNLFIIISKSGNTIETLTNINLIKINKLTRSNTIIITEEKANALNKFAKKFKLLVIEHKSFIGGRYSILSEVGMVPACIMGLNIKKLRDNLLVHFNIKKNQYLKNSISTMSQIYLSKKISSIVFFNYSSELDNFVYWCQQLIAESLGKKNKGLMPIFSSAPKDHHSLLQLYLDGPKDKIFYIISSNTKKEPEMEKNIFSDSLNYLNNKKISKIKSAQKNAFIKVLKRKKIPFREIEINKVSEETMGELFSYFIMEIALTAKLIGVNAFDQPAVEEVKNLTKKFLS